MQQMRTLYLKKREDRRIRAGHLWIFSNEIDVSRQALTDFAPGEAVEIRDAQGAKLGEGYVNPSSLIAVRLLTRWGIAPSAHLQEKEALQRSQLEQKDKSSNAADLVRERLKRALTLRERLFDVPYYRLCHSEGDFLPGLIVDRYGNILSVQFNTAGMEALREPILDALQELLRPSVIALRNDTASRALEGLPQYVECVEGSMPENVEVVENGARFAAPFAPGKGGQKTGWFYDQRVNRLTAGRFAGETALDAFSYAGGFGCMAALNGATHVTFMDASASALDAARENLRRNAPGAEAECLKGDALTLLENLRDEGRRFSLVCLDPPAFIKRKKDAAAGLAAYRRVNDLGLQLVEDGGTLITCSCSHHLGEEELHRLLTQSLARRGLHGQILYRGFQGPDHPVHPAMPETAYLKALLIRVWR